MRFAIGDWVVIDGQLATYMGGVSFEGWGWVSYWPNTPWLKVLHEELAPAIDGCTYRVARSEESMRKAEALDALVSKALGNNYGNTSRAVLHHPEGGE